MSVEFEKMPVQEQAELLAQQSANEAYLAFEEMMPEFQAAMAKAEQEAKIRYNNYKAMAERTIF